MQQKIISSKTRLLGLFGNPARHSLSPMIHNIFLKDSGIDAVYLTFEFPISNLEKAFAGAKNLGLVGLNITMPFKEPVFRLADHADLKSNITGSVNTVKFDLRTNTALGFNTDVDGFIKSLEDKDFKWESKNCLVLGAGGAAKSSVFAISEKKVNKIYVYNRTKEKTQGIRDSYKDEKAEIIEVLDSLEKIEKENIEVDLICNCTPMGMDNGNLLEIMPIPDNWNLKGKYIFEMVYKPVRTKLFEKGKNEGAVVVDGLDMLINQAATSFKIWFDIMPETKDIKEILSNYLKSGNPVN